MTTTIIPIANASAAASGGCASASSCSSASSSCGSGGCGTVARNDPGAHLERAGFMRMMDTGGPRLTELVDKFVSKGYEVEVVPMTFDDLEDEDGDYSAALAATAAPGRTYGTIYVRKLG
jgi:hypothetical protein